MNLHLSSIFFIHPYTLNLIRRLRIYQNFSIVEITHQILRDYVLIFQKFRKIVWRISKRHCLKCCTKPMKPLLYYFFIHIFEKGSCKVVIYCKSINIYWNSLSPLNILFFEFLTSSLKIHKNIGLIEIISLVQQFWNSKFSKEFDIAYWHLSKRQSSKCCLNITAKVQAFHIGIFKRYT